MKILILMDSFKGTISSNTLGKLMQESLKKENIKSDYFPISDGGDGFLDAIEKRIKTKKEYLSITGPLKKIIKTYYLTNLNTAYIEMAKASGLALLDKMSPDKANTYGFGEMILDAINKGFKEIILGIGGSATNDCGVGMLVALGVKFYDKNNQELNNITPVALDEINKIDDDNLINKLKGINFTVLSDVNNPLLGEEGATRVYGPQKGIKAAELNFFEDQIHHFASIVVNSTGKDERGFPGSGAAGGCGFALKSFFNPTFASGANYILDLIDFKNIEKNYDYIITGEGKFDKQSSSGKLISGILKNTNHEKVIIVCAINELQMSEYNVFAITDNLATKEESLNKPVATYKRICKEVVKFLKLQGESNK